MRQRGSPAPRIGAAGAGERPAPQHEHVARQTERDSHRRGRLEPLKYDRQHRDASQLDQ